jgi:TniQ
MVFPEISIWDRDIDKSANDEVISVLSEKTKTTFEKAGDTTLSNYENIFFETYNFYGPTPWILPVGIYGRFRKNYGQQFCPICLYEDKEPYYRRRWRMAFVICCDFHGILLFDRCPDCQSPVNFHRDELGDFHKVSANTITKCHVCGLDFCYLGKTNSFEKVSTNEWYFTKKLLSPLNNEIIRFGEEEFIFPQLFFQGFRQLIKCLSFSDVRVKKMRDYLINVFQIDFNDVQFVNNKSSKPLFEKMEITQRRQLLNIGRCLIVDWSDTFLEVSKTYKVWSSIWLKHLETEFEKYGRNQKTAPYWYYKAVRELYRPIYRPTSQEIMNAISYIKKTNGSFCKSELRKYFGDAVVYRKLKLLLENQ